MAIIIPLPDGTPIPPGPPPTGARNEPPPSAVTPLDLLREIVGYNPFQWWGMASNLVPQNSAINTILAEHTWQNSNVAGRETMRQALYDAEQKLLTAGALQFYPAPRQVEVTLPYPQYFNQQMWGTVPVDGDGKWISVTLPEGYVEAVGVETFTFLTTAIVSYSAQSGSGLNDTFTISVTTTETDISKLQVYFSAGDRLNNNDIGERWRIKPVNITLSGGVATITGRSWLLVKPILYEGYTNVSPLDPSTSSNFVSTLEIYSRSVDPNGTTVATSQGEFVWNTLPYPQWATCCNSNSVNHGSRTDPASQAYALARVGIRDAKNGFVIPGEAVYNTTTQTWSATYPNWFTNCRAPDSVVIRYRAGYPLDADGNGNRRLAKAVCYLALADMPERIEASDVANRVWYRWQEELNRLGNQTMAYAVSKRDLNNPFGNRRGHQYAWNEIQQLRLVRGAGVG